VVKAFLLAAGKGTRLRPLTNKIPKCLIPINGKPLLRIWFDLLKLHGITDVLINLHHHPHLVAEYIRNNAPEGVNINMSYEQELLGSAGTVSANKKFVEHEDSFFILYADNLTNVNLSMMLDFHNRHRGIFTIGLFRTNCPTQCGVVELNNKGLVTSFVEKPEVPSSDLASAGVFIANHKLFSYLPKGKADFGLNVLPKLVNKMYGYIIHEYLSDIGTVQNYEFALNTWRG
jgi:mannose-1-phosphate guanylyltransferase